MSRLDQLDRPTARQLDEMSDCAYRRWAVRSLLEAHANGGRCIHCSGDYCPAKAGAEEYHRQWTAQGFDVFAPTPPPAPPVALP